MAYDDGHYEELTNCVCIAATAKAVLVQYGDKGTEFWVPRSVVIEEGSDVEERGDTGSLVIKQWFWRRLQEEHDLE